MKRKNPIPEMGWGRGWGRGRLRVNDSSWLLSGLRKESKGLSLLKVAFGQNSEAASRRARLRGMISAKIAPPHIFL